MASTDGSTNWFDRDENLIFARTYVRELLLYLWFLTIGFGVTLILAQVNPRFDIDIMGALVGSPMGWVVVGTALVVLPAKAALGRGVLHHETDVWQITRTSIVFTLLIVVLLFGTHVATNAGGLLAGGHLGY